jgi:hypothetical protein
VLNGRLLNSLCCAIASISEGVWRSERQRHREREREEWHVFDDPSSSSSSSQLFFTPSLRLFLIIIFSSIYLSAQSFLPTVSPPPPQPLWIQIGSSRVAWKALRGLPAVSGSPLALVEVRKEGDPVLVVTKNRTMRDNVGDVLVVFGF